SSSAASSGSSSSRCTCRCSRSTTRSTERRGAAGPRRAAGPAEPQVSAARRLAETRLVLGHTLIVLPGVRRSGGPGARRVVVAVVRAVTGRRVALERVAGRVAFGAQDGKHAAVGGVVGDEHAAGGSAAEAEAAEG